MPTPGSPSRSAPAHFVRDEYEYPITVEDARELMTTALGIVIEKTRYTVDHEGFVWEVDVFDGIYRGLVVAEVEMKRETTPSTSRMAWPGSHGDRRYSNQHMALEDLSGEAVPCPSGLIPPAPSSRRSSTPG